MLLPETFLFCKDRKKSWGDPCGCPIINVIAGTNAIKVRLIAPLLIIPALRGGLRVKPAMTIIVIYSATQRTLKPYALL
jgi:hypothetical protein